jgi:hypothetical protein
VATEENNSKTIKKFKAIIIIRIKRSILVINQGKKQLKSGFLLDISRDTIIAIIRGDIREDNKNIKRITIIKSNRG